MSIRKYQLHPDHCVFIRNKRKELKIPAENLSEQIGKAKSWLSQVERGVFATIRHEDLVRLLRVLYEASSITQDDELLLKQFFDDVSNLHPSDPMEHLNNFNLLNQANYDSFDLQKEFDIALQNLINTMRNSFSAINTTEQQFSMLQALKTQDKNLQNSVDLTNRLNSLPLFTLHNENKAKNEVTKQIHELHELLLSDIESRIAFFNLCGITWLNDIISATINATKEAIRVLLEILSPECDSAALIEKYNSLIEEINLNCKMQCLSDTVLYSINNTDIQHLNLAGKHLSGLQKLLQELTDIQMKTR